MIPFVYIVLSAIICTSLSEDTYGAVQSKIPQILKAFVRFLDEIDVLSSQLSSQLSSTTQTSGTATGTGGTTEEEEIRKVLDALGHVTCRVFPQQYGIGLLEQLLAGSAELE